MQVSFIIVSYPVKGVRNQLTPKLSLALTENRFLPKKAREALPVGLPFLSLSPTVNQTHTLETADSLLQIMFHYFIVCEPCFVRTCLHTHSSLRTIK